MGVVVVLSLFPVYWLVVIVSLSLSLSLSRFRMKYHPEDMVSRRAESQAALKSRMGVFLFLLENGWLDNMSLDMEHAPKIIKLLDAGRGAGGWTV